MNRQQLEHIIRAAADIADDDDVIVIGSQSILAQHPNAPAALLQSMEADVFPRTHSERAAIIDGAIGELSMFHETFGYYAQGVAPETATLPDGWQSRLVAIKARSATGWCLRARSHRHPHRPPRADRTDHADRTRGTARANPPNRPVRKRPETLVLGSYRLDGDLITPAL